MGNDPDQLDLFYRFGIALVIGFLIGLQREYAYGQEKQQDEDEELFAGARTFALLGLVGCAAALAAQELGEALAFVAVLGLAGVIIVIAYYASVRNGQLGITTEIAALVTMLAGALCYWDYLGLAAAVAVVTTTLLTLKLQTRQISRNITREDVFATLKFAVITLIVLPILPREGYGPPPFDVLVPYNIWLMVVFISGISFLGYVLIKIIGTERGVGLTGILGGLASSTAVTLSFAQRSRDAPALAKPFALAILLAWTIMFARVIVEVAALNRPLLARLWLPMAAAGVAGLAYCGYLYFAQRSGTDEQQDDFANPFQLKPALTFGALYALILVAANAARMYFGETGVYVSSVLSGLADVDAITLSMAELSQNPEELDLTTATRAIVLAAASNTIVKGGIVLSTGSAALRKAILPGLVLTLATALGVAFLL